MIISSIVYFVVLCLVTPKVFTGSKIKSNSHHGWIDCIAISMSIICAIHCLLTPVLIVFFPILATTIWVKHDFHLWMILFVLPITATAIFLGCRKHKDKAILFLSATGLSLLTIVALYEAFSHYMHLGCSHHGDGAEIFTISTIINILGGILLSCAHIRNYWLCRNLQCSHQ